MAVADLVAEVFEDEAIRGPLATRGVLYTVDGRVGRGYGGRVPDTTPPATTGERPGQSTIAKGGSGALADGARGERARRSASTIRTGAEVARDPLARRPRASA